VQAYFASETARSTGAYQVSQLVWALFLGFTVIFTYGSRETVRELLERRWRAGIGLKRVLIAGAGDLGRLVADRILQHRELGYQVAASWTIAPAATTSATAGCRCSARWPR
jgi:FlaA1/EpsC-like NDP-sugar epimerase